MTSPFQVLGAVEAKARFEDAETACHVILPEPPNDATAGQIESCLELTTWKSVTRIARDQNCFRRAGQAAKELGGIDSLYLGDYREPIGIHLVHHLRPHRFVILDDGTAIHRFAPNRFVEAGASGSPAAPTRWFWLERTKRRLRYGYKSGPLPSATVFSIYEHVQLASCDRLVVNRFDFLRRNRQIRSRPGEAWVIGACLAEIGVLDSTDYEQLLAVVREVAGSRRIKYFPHRREDTAKFPDYSRRFGFDIVRSSKPIELEVIERETIAELVIGLYSTALDSLRVLSGDEPTQFVAIEVPYDKIRSKADIPFIRATYGYFSHYRERFQIICPSRSLDTLGTYPSPESGVIENRNSRLVERNS